MALCLGKYCPMNLIEFFEVYRKVDEGIVVAVVYVDYSKAFDKIRRKQLLSSKELFMKSPEVQAAENDVPMEFCANQERSLSEIADSTQDVHASIAQIGLKSMNVDPEKTINDTPHILPRTPEQVEPGQKEFGMNSNLTTGKTPLKSPGFCFLNTSTPKSTEFNLFGRTAFDLSNTPEQMTDNQMSSGQFEFSSLFFKKTSEKGYSSNITSNLPSSQKDIGMDSPSNDQPFTFSFQSDILSNNFGNCKDEFNFGFSFGQDQKSSQPGLFKFF
ncbi:uncharacterized protein LOC125455538 [Stegostoma tigrinum]|uniref:uncharacterized protein LOC125455538 n=1 Tax=Stegostoma tigrinum TaxID=3053191 RepID=UPI00202B0500|nr:uncharacterized protein LOC125455538 [Stegostoma tigrinum]